jgi:L-lactate dehydrogenase (cytochrome)
MPAATPPVPRRLRRVLSLDDLESAAQRHLPRPIFGYVAGAAEDNRALRDNRAAFAEWGFVPRALRDTSARSNATTLFGEAWAQPFGIAPTGLASLVAYRGDIALAEAAAAANIPMLMSGASLIAMEEVVRANPRAWFQAYLVGEQAEMMGLVARAARAGFGTLAVTVDVPAIANRENNVRTGFTVPLRPSLRLAWDGVTHPAWSIFTLFRTLLRHGMPHFENHGAMRGMPMLSRHVEQHRAARDTLDWRILERVRAAWPGRLLIKGVMDPADARLARELGADGVIVSNHGGRQLDAAVSPLRVLPGVVAAAGGMVVMLDSGVRRGGDVLTALALGAKFVFLGRPFLFAAALGGAAGVQHAIGLLAEEIRRNMAMLGIGRLDEVGPDRLHRLAGFATQAALTQGDGKR